METVFSLISEAERAVHLRSLMQAFGCNYICLWLYLPQPTHSLYFLDGYYNEENNGAQRLFDEYRREVFFIVNDRVPGTAFFNNQPYLELTESELVRMVSVAVQRQFYQEARIKTAVFMGCRSGEIEMGWSNEQMNMENAMRNWFSEGVPQQFPIGEVSQPIDPNRPSSSSSSLRSLSMDSPESSSFLFNLHTQSNIPEISQQDPTIPPTTSPSIQLPIFQPLQTLTTSSHQQAMQAFALSRNIQLPNRETEDAAMTRAILAVLSSASSNSTTTSPSNPNLRPRTTAFKKYRSSSTPTIPVGPERLHRRSLLKRAITYYKGLNIARREYMQQPSRPSSTQLHHMISERKRREKINESFEALRKLLPPESKKDKASVLIRTREYLTSLRDQVAELSERNQKLESQMRLLPAAAKEGADEMSGSSRVEVRVTHVPESTSEEERLIDLQVSVQGDSSSLSNVVIRVLEFLRQDRNVSLISMEATTLTTQTRSFNRLNLRLRIEGSEWDESAFQEAVIRVVADLAL